MISEVALPEETLPVNPFCERDGGIVTFTDDVAPDDVCPVVEMERVVIKKVQMDSNFPERLVGMVSAGQLFAGSSGDQISPRLAETTLS